MAGVAKKRDWGLVVAGALLLVCAVVCLAAPGITLATIALVAGASLLVSGVFDIAGWVRFRAVMPLSGWVVAYAVLDIVIGLMLVVHPIALASVIPWMVGFFFILFGAFEVVGAFFMRRAGLSSGWMMLSGAVSALCGVMFFVTPEMLSMFLALFLLMRGASLIFYGWNAGQAMSW